MTSSPYPFYEPAELVEHNMLSLHELARHCATSPQWVIEHVQIGTLCYDSDAETSLTPDAEDSAPITVELASARWRFSSQTLVRAKRIAQLEHSFDADPQLAALTTDLIEEVLQLRRQLRQLQR